MRILVVEDERKVTSFTARALREDAYAVDVAENGERALEMAGDASYEVILLDIRLPGLNGIQVCLGIACNPASRRHIDAHGA